MFNKQAPNVGLLNKKPHLAVTLGVTKFVPISLTHLVTLCCLVQVTLMFSKPATEVGLLNIYV